MDLPVAREPVRPMRIMMLGGDQVVGGGGGGAKSLEVGRPGLVGVRWMVLSWRRKVWGSLDVGRTGLEGQNDSWRILVNATDFLFD